VSIVANVQQITADRVREEINDYETTIAVLHSLICAVAWDEAQEQLIPEYKHSFGRRMTRTTKKAGINEAVVTPDAVIQRTTRLGYVVEVKRSLPSTGPENQDQDRWRKVVEQLQKYDDDLVGWWTEDERIDRSCVVLVLDATRAVVFRDYLQMLERDEGLSFKHPFSLVEFSQPLAVNQYLLLRKFWGNIEDQGVSEKLRKGTPIPMEKVLVFRGKKRFYDASPICEYTMRILWQDIFNARRPEGEFEEEKRAWLLKVNVEKLAEDLQRTYGSIRGEARDRCYPRTGWVREAMEAFVRLNLARRLDERGEYQVYFKQLRGDIIERFVKHRDPQGRARQIPLFDLNGTDPDEGT